MPDVRVSTPHGLRHTVWVLLDDDIEDISEDSTENTNGHSPASVSTPEATPRQRTSPSRLR